MEMDEAEFRIKFVEYAIIIHTEFEFHPALQSFVCEGFQMRVQLALRCVVRPCRAAKTY